eukprot:scaffold952_cov409-Prasinococcus_capsulatus_cf.AAC.18
MSAQLLTDPLLARHNLAIGRPGHSPPIPPADSSSRSRQQQQQTAAAAADSSSSCASPPRAHQPTAPIATGRGRAAGWTGTTHGRYPDRSLARSLAGPLAGRLAADAAASSPGPPLTLRGATSCRSAPMPGLSVGPGPDLARGRAGQYPSGNKCESSREWVTCPRKGEGRGVREPPWLHIGLRSRGPGIDGT